MVMRATDAPRSVPEHVRAANARAAAVERGLGRGASALRNGTHALYLDPNSANPLLTPTQTDSGMVFRDTAVEFVGGDGTGYRDVAARGIDARGTVRAGGVTATGGIYSDFEIIAQSGIRSEFGISTPGDMVATGRGSFNNVAITGNSIFSWDRDGAIRWEDEGALTVANRSGTARRGVFASNFVDNQGSLRSTSERALKDPEPDIADALAIVRRWRPGRFRWKRCDDAHPEGLHASIYVDELDHPDTPELVAGRDEHDNRVPDDRAVIAYLAAAVQQQDRENAALRDELTEQRAITDRLTVRLDALEGAA